jgi:hypothetical protein
MFGMVGGLETGRWALGQHKKAPNEGERGIVVGALGSWELGSW